VYAHLGGYGIVMLVMVLIPMTVMCLIHARWGLAWVPTLVGWMVIRQYRSEDKKRDEEQARRAEVRAMVDDVLSSGKASCELTREQIQRIRTYL
jgi:hypothetical protein